MSDNERILLATCIYALIAFVRVSRPDGTSILPCACFFYLLLFWGRIHVSIPWVALYTSSQLMIYSRLEKRRMEDCRDLDGNGFLGNRKGDD